MNFTTFHFMLFLAAVAAVYYLLPQALRNPLLVAASYYFYFQAGASFWGYVAGTTLLTYGAALLMEKLSDKKRAAVKILTLAACLTLLVLLKYPRVTVPLVRQLSGGALGAQRLLLSAGASFYTFSVVGYTLDVAAGRIAAERNPFNYAMFVSFFPHILSGPIPRGAALLPQMREKHALQYENLLHGAQRFFWGLFKKALLADWFAVLVDGLYADARNKSGIVLLAAALMYMIQLYLDFSGYTDMALGAARVLGFKLGENFESPLFSGSITEFWKRWHISLTSWLRDYIYIPLGGNRRGFARKLIHILIVFLISGLWHGSNYNYLVWGAAFGLFRVAEELLRRRSKPLALKKEGAQTLWSAAKRLGTFVLVSALFVFFRVTYFSDALHVLTHMFYPLNVGELYYLILNAVTAHLSSDAIYVYFTLLVLGGGLLLVALLEYKYLYKDPAEGALHGNVLARLPSAARWLCYIGMALALLLLGKFGTSNFLYIVY